MKVVLIYNQKSGGRYNLRRIKRIFRQHDVVVSYSFTIDQLASKKLRGLVKRGVTVAAVGGDGTINSVARLVVGTKSVLLPLPGGTLNHFVQDLGMPGNIDDVIAGVKSAKPRQIDVGYVNDELFLNNSSLGIYPFTLIDRKSSGKVMGKWLAASLAAVKQLTIFKRHRLVIDGKRVHSPFVFVGNNLYGIKKSLVPERTSLTKGILTLMVATSSSRLSLVKAAFAVVRGDISKQDDFSFSTRKSVTIYSRRSTIPVSFDGEVKRLKPPLDYRVAPKVLTVLIVKAR